MKFYPVINFSNNITLLIEKHSNDYIIAHFDCVPCKVCGKAKEGFCLPDGKKHRYC